MLNLAGRFGPARLVHWYVSRIGAWESNWMAARRVDGGDHGRPEPRSPALPYTGKRLPTSRSVEFAGRRAPGRARIDDGADVIDGAGGWAAPTAFEGQGRSQPSPRCGPRGPLHPKSRAPRRRPEPRPRMPGKRGCPASCGGVSDIPTRERG